jgi:hypothetical protein
MKLTPGIWALAFAPNCTTLLGRMDRKKYGVRFALAFGLSLGASPLVHAQQYMKSLPTSVTDAKFDEWKEGQVNQVPRFRAHVISRWPA